MTFINQALLRAHVGAGGHAFLMSATLGAARAVALERLARALAQDLPADVWIRPAEIAFAILNPADPENRSARDYYRRLDQRPSTEDAQNG